MLWSSLSGVAQGSVITPARDTGLWSRAATAVASLAQAPGEFAGPASPGTMRIAAAVGSALLATGTGAMTALAATGTNDPLAPPPSGAQSPPPNLVGSSLIGATPASSPSGQAEAFAYTA